MLTKIKEWSAWLGWNQNRGLQWLVSCLVNNDDARQHFGFSRNICCNGWTFTTRAGSTTCTACPDSSPPSSPSLSAAWPQRMSTDPGGRLIREHIPLETIYVASAWTCFSQPESFFKLADKWLHCGDAINLHPKLCCYLLKLQNRWSMQMFACHAMKITTVQVIVTRV